MNAVIPVRTCGPMELETKTFSISPYADQAVLNRRLLPIISRICPKCRRPCDFDYVFARGTISCDIRCPDCGVTRVDSGLVDGELILTVDGTGEVYDDRANLEDAEARLKAVEGEPAEEFLAMAEVAWENYLLLPSKALPVWKEAVERFDSCGDVDEEHARGMVPWILRFCDLGGKALKEIDLIACRKVTKILGKPSTAEECMLWMDRFELECRSHSISDEVAAIPDIAKEAYNALSESEKAICPTFPVIGSLMMLEHSYDLWEAGYIDLEEHELDRYDLARWDEVLSETREMLDAGASMTPRVFRAFCHVSEPISLALDERVAIRQFEELADRSGGYADAFRAKAEIMEVLMMTREEPIMPYFHGARFDWDDESFGKLEDAIRKLEGYADPAIIRDPMADAYYLLYMYDGSPDILEYCDQLTESTENKLLDIQQRMFLDKSMFSGLLGSGGAPWPISQNQAKPKRKSKKERVAERRKAHIAKRK